MRVLVVNDDAEMAQSFRLLLEVCGHKVATADGDSALAVAEAFQPDAAIVDLRVGGDQLARRLRELPGLGDAGVFIVTWPPPS